MRATAVGLLLLTIFVAGYHGQQKHPQPSNIQKASQRYPTKTVAPIAQIAATKQEKSTCQKTKGYLRKAFGPEYLATWILVVAAGIGIAFTVLTVRTLRRQILLEQRPKIYVRNFYFDEPKAVGGLAVATGPQSGSLLGGQFYVANCGGSDAHIQEWYCRVLNGSILPMKRPYEGEGGIKSKRTVSPGESFPYTFNRSNEPLSSKELGQLASGGRVLYVMGWIEYTDDLKIRRRTAFCRRYDFGFMRFVPVGNRDYEHSD
ncbi:MAG: hypothetical protein ACYDCM_04290 [Candidatus Acidiferrales bacterium]